MKNRYKVFKSEHRDILGALKFLLGFCLVYGVILILTPLTIPCIFRIVTGFYCPGCGITRFFSDLFRLEFESAISQNLAFAVLFPLWLIIGVIEFLFNPYFLRKNSPINKFLLWFSIIFLVLFTVMRNIPMFSYLSPGGIII